MPQQQRPNHLCCDGSVLGDPGTPGELRERLINKITLVLSSGSDEECAICLDSLRQPVITYCAHVYCRPCICEVIRSEKVSITLVSHIFAEDSCIGLSRAVTIPLINLSTLFLKNP